MGGGGIVASFSLIGEKSYSGLVHGHSTWIPSSILCWFFYKDTFLVAATERFYCC